MICLVLFCYYKITRRQRNLTSEITDVEEERTWTSENLNLEEQTINELCRINIYGEEEEEENRLRYEIENEIINRIQGPFLIQGPILV